MKKGLVIKMAIVLVVLVLSYCVFWFFKAGQSEKQINKFIADNSNYISAGEISVSGFPANQKIIVNDLKITIPVNMIAKRQIHIKQLEARASIFSDNFVINFTDAVKLQDFESSGDIFDVEFAGQPEVSLTLADGVISHFKYTDSGFKVLDAEKNVVNSSTGTSISSETSIDETDKRTSKISVSFKELEGYTIIDFYKNVLDKKVIEGIKTEEIKVNASVQVSPLVDPSQIPAPNQVNPENGAQVNNVPNAPDVQNDPAQAPNTAQAPNALPAQNGEEAVKQAMAMADQAQANAQAQAQPQPSVDPNAPQAVNQTPDAISDTSIVKSNVVIEATITLTPSIKQDQPEPSDPTQIQELPVQFVQNVKIDNVEFSNPLYKINITGNVNSSSDDNYPSGGITIKIEKVVNLLEQLKKQFKQLSESKKSPSTPVASDVSVDQVQTNNPANYDLFLANVSERIVAVATEIASKNSVTKDEIAQFDVRREKNLEFLVNEVSVREIIGKF